MYLQNHLCFYIKKILDICNGRDSKSIFWSLFIQAVANEEHAL